LARFDNPKIKEYRVVCVPKLQWEFVPKRYALLLFGGSFWEQDYGIGMSLLKMVGPATVAFTGKRTYPSHENGGVNMIGASLTIPLRLERDLSVGTPHVTVNGPDRWEYGLRTRLIQPGHANSIHPGLAREPVWLVD
jgi:hypothetical protein